MDAQTSFRISSRMTPSLRLRRLTNPCISRGAVSLVKRRELPGEPGGELQDLDLHFRTHVRVVPRKRLAVRRHKPAGGCALLEGCESFDFPGKPLEQALLVQIDSVPGFHGLTVPGLVRAILHSFHPLRVSFFPEKVKGLELGRFAGRQDHELDRRRHPSERKELEGAGSPLRVFGQAFALDKTQGGISRRL